MKAAVYRKYGPPEVVQIEEVEKPSPEDNEVLLRIVASTVCSADWRLRKPDPPPVGWFMNGFPRPKKINILGMEFSGKVDLIGKDVTRFKVGDRVFGLTWRFGGHAEYACLSQDRAVTKMPDNASFEEAAAIPFGGISALHFLKKAGIKEGQEVLIYGASGSVGSAAIQIARYFGAHVTAVCSAANMGLVKRMGADEVIDYMKDDFSKAGRIYDIIHDTVGKTHFAQSMRALKRDGVYIDAGPGMSSVFGGAWARLSGAGKVKVIGAVAQGGVQELDFLSELVKNGEFKPVIDRHFPLADIAEAHRYAEAGHKKGNVIINIVPNLT
jgi:NADPH:quinone reductase-like Zn-dependent oxidoreductase